VPSVDGDSREQILAPIISQEVWAAGVTYYRSRTARIEESQDAGGGDVSETMLPATTEIKMSITRDGKTVFRGETVLAQLKRSPESLIEFLYRENSFPFGCVLLTGTGIVPPDDFTLQHGDEIGINIEPIGTLISVVE